MKFTRSKQLQSLSHRLIPGGAHTYAKGDDQFPELAPGFIDRGKGCHVWDVDGNEFIEYGMGLRAVTLGHGFAPVVNAAHRQMLIGTNFTRPSPVEVEAAQAMLSCVRGADMVKFTKDGSTATTAALKLARAFTGRDLVAFCIDHPFFSYDDWFIGKTPMDAGIPKAISDLSLTFHYNKIAELEALFAEHPKDIACVILEAERNDPPEDGFLDKVQALCRRHGALFVLDENITGFRWHLGGAQAVFGLTPDLSCFGKGMANGFALSALMGKREIMDLGGIHHSQPRVFLLSTTHGAENHALAACVATLQVYQEEPVIERLYRAGERLARGFDQVSTAQGLLQHVRALGRPCNLVFTTFDRDRQPSQPLRTLFMQELIRRGVIAPSLVLSYSHSDEDIDRTIEAVDGALAVYKQALDAGAERFLIGPPSKVVFRKMN